MDKIRANNLARDLKGEICCGWHIGKLINSGKSALVLRALEGRGRRQRSRFLIPELVEKHGAEVQIKRIEREKILIGKAHPNLVRIIDGGHWADKNFFFVVMEYLPWQNLAEALSAVPTGKERSIIRQVASAARLLEKLRICHRDIKPENIAISPDFHEVKLLDLGVIRPHGCNSITDGPNGRPFVGTLKYSPPEFLLGTVEDTKEGWRALTYYQLGGVLHDLIMRRSLFAEYENPFPRLVNAIQVTKPEIESASVSPALVELARDCLLKVPSTRLRLVSWTRFSKEPVVTDAVAEIQSRITRRLLSANDGMKIEDSSIGGTEEKLDEYADSLRSICRLECIENRKIFPPIEIHVRSDFAERRVSCAVY